MGNTVVMKLPRVGVLCHWPTWPLFKEFFPAGVVNVVSGAGRSTLPPIMKSGKIDIFGFIGTSQAADALQSAHPKPHRLRILFLFFDFIFFNLFNYFVYLIFYYLCSLFIFIIY